MSDFKSKIPWPGQGGNLPTYKGEPPGKAAVRKAETEAGGMQGIRRVDWKDEQGNSYTMNTRNGFPEVVRIDKKRAGTLTPPFNSVRGWVAHNVGATVAARFSPYTLAISDPNYKLFSTTYTILPFSTTFNVPYGDTTKWFDVLTFHKGTVKINGAIFSTLKYTGAPLKALPWLIPHTGIDVAKYGDEATNTYEKRIFAIERERVSILGGNSTTAILNNPSARPSKALMCGAKIEPALHKAWISQLAFTGGTWDELYGGWAFTSAHVSMLLTAPYLTQVNAGMSAEQSWCQATLGAELYDTAYSAPLAFPRAEIGVTGAAVLGYTDGISIQKVRYPSTDVIEGDIVGGNEHGTKISDPFYGVVSATLDILGKAGTYTCSSSFVKNRLLTQAGYPNQTFSINPSPATNYGAVTCYNNGTTSPASLELGPRGVGSLRIAGWTSAASSDHYQENSDVAFNVTLAGHVLVDGTVTRHKAYGQFFNNITKRPLLTDLLASGYVEYYPMDVVAYPPGDPAAITNMNSTAASFVGQLCPWRGDVTSIYEDTWHFTTEVGTMPAVDDRTLNWTTKDYILYDEDNGCYISVDAVFAGAQSGTAAGVAALTVNLTIITPSGTTVQTLFTTTFTYSEMLPEIPISIYNYVPAPQVRALFVPLFQEQGDFKGAAYTTSAEVSGGAVAAYLFNFVLKLDTYDNIGTDTSANPTINFIPCNLLEMLYAYVYSSRYGIDTYHRYPVDNTTRFNDLQNSLFTTTWRVNYRNGTLVDWLDTLGAPYVAPLDTELFRT